MSIRYVFFTALLGCLLAVSVQAQVPQPAQTPPAQTPTAPEPAVPFDQLSPPRQLERRGDILMARKLYHEAAEAYSQALRLEPRNAVILNKIGISWHQQLQLDEAKRFYERSIKVNSQYAEAYNNLGTVFYAKKNYKKALKNFRKALELKPWAASIHANLGMACFARKQYPEALSEFQRALSLDPEVFSAHRGFGVLLQERSVYERALFYYYLAKTFAAAGNLDRCLDYLKKAFEDGFRDVKRLNEDADFAQVRQAPQFQEFIQRLPAPLEP